MHPYDLNSESINSVKLLVSRLIPSQWTAAVTHLTFGPNAYVSGDRCVRPQVNGLLDADISQGIFPKDGASIQVGGHEATKTRECLIYFRKQKKRECEEKLFSNNELIELPKMNSSGMTNTRNYKQANTQTSQKVLCFFKIKQMKKSLIFCL